MSEISEEHDQEARLAGIKAMAQNLREKGYQDVQIQQHLEQAFKNYKIKFGVELNLRSAYLSRLETESYRGGDYIKTGRTTRHHVNVLNAKLFGVILEVNLKKQGEYNHDNIAVARALLKLSGHVEKQNKRLADLAPDTDLKRW